MSYIADIDYYSECSCPTDSSHTCTSGSAYCHENPAYCHHLGILPPLEHDMPGPSELIAPSEEATPAKQAIPSEEATLAEQTMPHEETTTVEDETPIQSTQETTKEPSSPYDPSTTT